MNFRPQDHSKAHHAVLPSINYITSDLNDPFLLNTYTTTIYNTFLLYYHHHFARTSAGQQPSAAISPPQIIHPISISTKIHAIPIQLVLYYYLYINLLHLFSKNNVTNTSLTNMLINPAELSFTRFSRKFLTLDNDDNHHQFMSSNDDVVVQIYHNLMDNYSYVHDFLNTCFAVIKDERKNQQLQKNTETLSHSTEFTQEVDEISFNQMLLKHLTQIYYENSAELGQSDSELPHNIQKVVVFPENNVSDKFLAGDIFSNSSSDKQKSSSSSLGITDSIWFMLGLENEPSKKNGNNGIKHLKFDSERENDEIQRSMSINYLTQEQIYDILTALLPISSPSTKNRENPSHSQVNQLYNTIVTTYHHYLHTNYIILPLSALTSTHHLYTFYPSSQTSSTSLDHSALTHPDYTANTTQPLQNVNYVLKSHKIYELSLVLRSNTTNSTPSPQTYNDFLTLTSTEANGDTIPLKNISNQVYFKLLLSSNFFHYYFNLLAYNTFTTFSEKPLKFFNSDTVVLETKNTSSDKLGNTDITSTRNNNMISRDLSIMKYHDNIIALNLYHILTNNQFNVIIYLLILQLRTHYHQILPKHNPNIVETLRADDNIYLKMVELFTKCGVLHPHNAHYDVILQFIKNAVNNALSSPAFDQKYCDSLSQSTSTSPNSTHLTDDVDIVNIMGIFSTLLLNVYTLLQYKPISRDLASTENIHNHSSKNNIFLHFLRDYSMNRLQNKNNDDDIPQKISLLMSTVVYHDNIHQLTQNERDSSSPLSKSIEIVKNDEYLTIEYSLQLTYHYKPVNNLSKKAKDDHKDKEIDKTSLLSSFEILNLFPYANELNINLVPEFTGSIDSEDTMSMDEKDNDNTEKGGPIYKKPLFPLFHATIPLSSPHKYRPFTEIAASYPKALQDVQTTTDISNLNGNIKTNIGHQHDKNNPELLLDKVTTYRHHISTANYNNLRYIKTSQLLHENTAYLPQNKSFTGDFDEFVENPRFSSLFTPYEDIQNDGSDDDGGMTSDSNNLFQDVLLYTVFGRIIHHTSDTTQNKREYDKKRNDNVYKKGLYISTLFSPLIAYYRGISNHLENMYSNHSKMDEKSEKLLKKAINRENFFITNFLHNHIKLSTAMYTQYISIVYTLYSISLLQIPQKSKKSSKTVQSYHFLKQSYSSDPGLSPFAPPAHKINVFSSLHHTTTLPHTPFFHNNPIFRPNPSFFSFLAHLTHFSTQNTQNVNNTPNSQGELLLLDYLLKVLNLQYILPFLPLYQGYITDILISYHVEAKKLLNVAPSNGLFNKSTSKDGCGGIAPFPRNSTLNDDVLDESTLERDQRESNGRFLSSCGSVYEMIMLQVCLWIAQYLLPPQSLFFTILHDFYIQNSLLDNYNNHDNQKIHENLVLGNISHHIYVILLKLLMLPLSHIAKNHYLAVQLFYGINTVLFKNGNTFIRNVNFKLQQSHEIPKKHQKMDDNFPNLYHFDHFISAFDRAPHDVLNDSIIVHNIIPFFNVYQCTNVQKNDGSNVSNYFLPLLTTIPQYCNIFGIDSKTVNIFSKNPHLTGQFCDNPSKFSSILKKVLFNYTTIPHTHTVAPFQPNYGFTMGTYINTQNIAYSTIIIPKIMQLTTKNNNFLLNFFTTAQHSHGQLRFRNGTENSKYYLNNNAFVQSYNTNAYTNYVENNVIFITSSVSVIKVHQDHEYMAYLNENSPKSSEEIGAMDEKSHKPHKNAIHLTVYVNNTYTTSTLKQLIDITPSTDYNTRTNNPAIKHNIDLIFPEPINLSPQKAFKINGKRQNRSKSIQYPQNTPLYQYISGIIDTYTINPYPSAEMVKIDRNNDNEHDGKMPQKKLGDIVSKKDDHHVIFNILLHFTVEDHFALLNTPLLCVENSVKPPTNDEKAEQMHEKTLHIVNNTTIERDIFYNPTIQHQLTPISPFSEPPINKKLSKKIISPPPRPPHTIWMPTDYDILTTLLHPTSLAQISHNTTSTPTISASQLLSHGINLNLLNTTVIDYVGLAVMQNIYALSPQTVVQLPLFASNTIKNNDKLEKYTLKNSRANDKSEKNKQKRQSHLPTTDLAVVVGPDTPVRPLKTSTIIPLDNISVTSSHLFSDDGSHSTDLPALSNVSSTGLFSEDGSSSSTMTKSRGKAASVKDESPLLSSSSGSPVDEKIDFTEMMHKHQISALFPTTSVTFTNNASSAQITFPKLSELPILGVIKENIMNQTNLFFNNYIYPFVYNPSSTIPAQRTQSIAAIANLSIHQPIKERGVGKDEKTVHIQSTNADYLDHLASLKINTGHIPHPSSSTGASAANMWNEFNFNINTTNATRSHSATFVHNNNVLHLSHGAYGGFVDYSSENHYSNIPSSQSEGHITHNGEYHPLVGIIKKTALNAYKSFQNEEKIMTMVNTAAYDNILSMYQSTVLNTNPKHNHTANRKHDGGLVESSPNPSTVRIVPYATNMIPCEYNENDIEQNQAISSQSFVESEQLQNKRKLVEEKNNEMSIVNLTAHIKQFKHNSYVQNDILCSLLTVANTTQDEIMKQDNCSPAFETVTSMMTENMKKLALNTQQSHNSHDTSMMSKIECGTTAILRQTLPERRT